MKNNKYTVLSFLGMLALSVMLVSCYSLWDDLSAAPKVTITYVSEKGTPPAPKQVNVGHKLTAADLPNIETDTEYGIWDKAIGTEITADTTITATNWETIVYLDYSGDFKSDFPIPSGTTLKSINIVRNHTFTDTPIDCAAGSDPDYFSYEYETEGNESTLWISGNGHRIYAPEDSNCMFYDLSSVTTVDLSNLYTSKVEIMDYMFGDSAGITSILFGPGFDTSNVEYMEGMFQSCHGLESLDVSGFNTSKVTTMYQMFEHCDNLTTLDLSSFNTETVTDMGSMFNDCKKLTSLDVSSFDTSSVTSMGDMFSNCEKLTTLDVSSFNTEKVTNMGSMFNSCKELTSLDVSNFDTSVVTNMSNMFKSCTALTTLDLSHFRTPNATNMGGMFASCTKLSSLNVSNFDTSKVTGFANMFNSCTSLTSLDLSSFDTTAVHAIGATMCWSMFSNNGTDTNPLIITASSKWTITNSAELQTLGVDGNKVQLNII